VVGSSVFSPAELARVTAPFTQRQLSFAELLEARSAITQFYVKQGYVTSGAFIPPQTLTGGVVTIQVLEGRLEEIAVRGSRRLQPGYIRDRLALAGATPLNLQRLQQGLQLLLLDPTIETLSAELSAGVRPGTNRLDVEVQEADSFSVDLTLDNARSPSVGSFRRQLQVSEGNLSGWADRAQLAYSNTDGSNTLEVNYAYPFNARNGTLNLSFAQTWSEIIEADFEILDIDSNSQQYEISFRQPIWQTPAQELALDLGFSYQSSKATFEPPFSEELPFPSLGADADGRTRIAAVRFSQEWTQRGRQQVFAARSELSLGLDALDSTINEDGEVPDSQFLAWRGQTQWARLLAPEMLLLLRGDFQLADRSLVPVEQFRLGGGDTIRGYRQDVLLTDSGALGSAEIHLPIYQKQDVVVQFVPFADVGTGWNREASNPDPDPDTLASVGIGALVRAGDRLNARIDWGIPLVEVDSSDRTWQENGIHFSVSYSF
jgi:hemolysin activation/secretion protein